MNIYKHSVYSNICLKFIITFFCRTGVWTCKAGTLQLEPYFQSISLGHFEDRVSQTICLGYCLCYYPGQPRTSILWTLSSQVARITGMSHWHLSYDNNFKKENIGKVWQFLIKLNTELPYDSIILLLVIHLKEPKARIWTNICTPMFKEVVFTITKEIIQVSINRWRYKQNRAYAQNGIFSCEKD
jgi:hypothetical protein